MPDQIEVSGLTELRQALKILPEALQGKASQAALAKAARPIVRAAQQKAPTRKPRGFIGPVRPEKAKGGLRAAIYSYRNRESTKTFESRYIGVKGKAWYWRFIEFGRASISRAKGSLGNPIKGFFGKVVKAVPAKPFLRPAFDENAEQAIEIYRDALLPSIEKVAKQAYARSQRRLRKYITGF
jgi:HK97 gp10 family phage protein